MRPHDRDYGQRPLGMITNPRGKSEAQACQEWSKAITAAGHLLLVPEIIDYEHRRELLLNDSQAAIVRLDRFKENSAYLSVSENAYLQAAQFWATARRQGMPTAGKEALDVDVILAAQAAGKKGKAADWKPHWKRGPWKGQKMGGKHIMWQLREDSSGAEAAAVAPAMQPLKPAWGGGLMPL